MKWRVTHVYEGGGVAVEAPIPGYPALEASFEYNAAGALVSVAHTIEIDDALHAADAIRESDSRLRALWALLEFLRGGPLPRRSPRAQRVLPPAPPGGPVQLEAHVVVSATVSAIFTRVLRFPREPAAIAADPRLLERANGARDEEDHAHAVRDYYSILEALGVVPPPELKHVRDFVSHGRVDSAKLKAYVQAEIGDPSVDRYDPADPRHQQLVSRWRTAAKRLVERELHDRLR